MAHTKQTPRNPNLERPTAAMGSDVQPQPESKSSLKTNLKENSYERRKTTMKAFIT